MKVSARNEDLPFTPVTLTITFESSNEMAEFYAIHNVCAIVDSTPSLDHERIRDALPRGCDKPVFDRVWDAVRNHYSLTR